MIAAFLISIMQQKCQAMAMSMALHGTMIRIIILYAGIFLAIKILDVPW
jgi:hypothetical protein